MHDVNGHRLHRSESREERAGDDELAERGEVACLRHRVIHDKLEDVQGQYNGKAQRRSIVQISRRQEEAFEIKRERERDRVEVSTSAVGCIGACSLPNPAHHSEQRDHQSKV